MPDRYLSERMRIPTSGARAVAPFTLEGRSFLAIPQLSSDAPGTPAGMNGGDSDTDLLLLRREGGGYVEHQRIPAPGGEDAEFFRVGEQAFLAVASIRSGRGPYDYQAGSSIYSWDGRRFVIQSVPTFAAKQWRHFEIDGRHFLGLAQGVSLPQHKDHNRTPWSPSPTASPRTSISTPNRSSTHSTDSAHTMGQSSGSANSGDLCDGSDGYRALRLRVS
jgi:hypothetical protein